jgi:hypothetical protein
LRIELGRCLLNERLLDAGMTLAELSAALRTKPERLLDYRDDKRIMPLKAAISIAGTIGCDIKSLYEIIPMD